MVKKIAVIVSAAALVFGGLSQTGIGQSLANSLSYVCYAHDGAGWSN